MNEWRPISTAPRDETEILVWWSDRVAIASWNLECQNWQEYPDGDFEDIAGEEVTHWMPLPDAPKEFKRESRR